MSWAERRKAIYTLSFFAIIIVLLLIFILPSLNKPVVCAPTDCGGDCAKLCVHYNDPSIVWVRWSKVANTSSWSILAYGQNPNIGAGAYNVPYHYKVYDPSGLLLYENSGTTYIPPSNNFVVFDDGIDIGDKTPGRVDFTFATSSIVWQKIPSQELGIETLSQNLVGTDTKPKLFATLKNTTAKPIKDIESLAILYDADGNAIAFSKTETDSIDSGGTSDIVFTWPGPFQSPVYKIDIVSEVMSQ